MATAPASTRRSSTNCDLSTFQSRFCQHTAATSCNLWISVPLESSKRSSQSFLSLQGTGSAKSARSSLTRHSLPGGMPRWRISSRLASREAAFGPSILKQCSQGTLQALSTKRQLQDKKRGQNASPSVTACLHAPRTSKRPSAKPHQPKRGKPPPRIKASNIIILFPVLFHLQFLYCTKLNTLYSQTHIVKPVSVQARWRYLINNFFNVF